MDKIAQVTGVLRYNDKTRDEMLRRIYWKDEQYTSLGGNFVRYANIEDREVTSLTEGKGLQNYTYDEKTDYGKSITHKYLGQRELPHSYSTNDYSSNPELRKWEGDYLYNFVWETRLNDIGIAKRVNESAVAIIADENRFLVSKYITPELTKFYQDFPSINLRTVKNSLDQYYTGRIPDIKEADAKFVHDYQDFLERRGNTAVGKQISEMLHSAGNVNSKYVREEQDEKGNVKTIDGIPVYVEASKEEGDYFFNLTGIDEDNDVKTFDSNGRYWTPYTRELQYIEGDLKNENGRRPDVSTFINIKGDDNSKSLLAKTNKLFNQHKISTLAARFHTSNEVNKEIEMTDSAKSLIYGNSHGRNLLRKNPKHFENGYSDPYCRVWTYHHQYDRFSKLIRPFSEEEGDIYSEEFLPYKTSNGGRENLKKRTVLDNLTNTVKIAPSTNGGIAIKDCMFSIENLAWKDVPDNKTEYLSKEQRGPNGGRIMWFPPYDLNFNEQVQVGWQQHTFIGRGEPIFTYNNTTRRGTLSFALLIDHPSIINNIPKNSIRPSDGDGDIEADVLRFFAGCQIPDLTTLGITPSAEVEEKKAPDNEPQLTIPEDEKSKRVKFYVYFPNNYSGNGKNMNGKATDSTDVDWFDYILFGTDAKYGENLQVKGYEMDSNGVSDSRSDSGNSMPVYEVTTSYKSGSGSEVKDVYYKYRVDFDLHQKLVNQKKDGTSRGMVYEDTNYADSIGFSLNSTKNENADATHSFTEIVSAMYQAHPEYFKGTLVEKHKNEVLRFLDTAKPENQKLINLFKGNEYSNMKFEAGATTQDSKNSQKLAIRRGYALKDLILVRGKMEKIEKEGEIDLPTPAIKLNYQGTLNDKTTVNTLEAKKQRYASLEIFYDAPQIEKVSDTVHATTGTTIEETDVNAEEGQNKTQNETTQEMVARSLISSSPTSSLRYETEGEYFHRLEKDDPIAFKNIVDKFRYFSPAYHSISPEGFNARLTFLHQCTRQGHTVSASDGSYAMTAGNLSFGRMPVCVLKIGDFINTRIVIESVSINYDAQGTPQWDLNPEGIGVQPMYAKVQMSIAILGGQSLDGPINRLQNAVTFNYYANTGAYDNRSDVINLETKSSNEVLIRSNKDKNENIVDKSKYVENTTVYKNIFTPYPDIEVRQTEKDVNKYNEDKAKGKKISEEIMSQYTGYEVDESGSYDYNGTL